MSANEWLFTFGFGQQHPNKFVRIKGTYSDARQEMFKRYGAQWSMQYPASDEEKLKSYAIKELKHG